MKYTLGYLKYLIIIIACFVILTGFTFGIEEQANSSIKLLYHKLNVIPNTSMASRIDWISAQFMNKPYALGSLGEGPGARYDQFPQYRVDAFDCDTYVNTVLSLALANSLHSFQQCIKYMRYKNGKVAYLHRNHFTSIDWNQYHQQRGILKDITRSIKDQNNHAVAQWAKAMIDKPAWYAHKPISAIRLQIDNKAEQEKRLAELKIKGSILHKTLSKIPYLPFSALFLKNNKPNLYLFSQIPHGAIIEIIRPNWDLRQQIGTSLNVSHLGFAIRAKGKLLFREASSQLNKVVDVPLIEYLKEAKNNPTIKGINVQVVLPEKPVCYLR